MKNWRKWGGVDKFLPHFGGGTSHFCQFFSRFGGERFNFLLLFGGETHQDFVKMSRFFWVWGGLDKSLKKWGGCWPKAGKMGGV